jgi:hypothetical protein
MQQVRAILLKTEVLENRPFLPDTGNCLGRSQAVSKASLDLPPLS